MNPHVDGGAPTPGDVPIDLVDEAGLEGWLEGQPESTRRWVRVAACNHRAFCSQTSAIPARIICE